MTKLLLVVANYYPDISKKLLDSSLITLNTKLNNNTINDYDISVINAPGVFEIPVIIAKNINDFDGFIALGCVIKGGTPHFELISKSYTDGIMKLSIEYKKPIGNGVLTCLNKGQALTRIDKGIEATNAVLQVLKNEIS